MTQINLEDFRRFPTLKKEDIQHLREWNRKQAHLPTVSDDQLVKFLIKSRLSLEKAKKTIDTCFTVRTHFPEVFDRLDPLLPEIQTVWKHVNMGLLPKADPDGNRILFMRLISDNPIGFVHEDHMRLFEMVLSVILSEGATPGMKVAVDGKNLSFGHVTKVNFVWMRKYLLYMQEGMMLRLISVHIFNHSPVVDKFMSLLRPLIKPKLANKFQFHSTLDDLYQSIHQETLPSDYGGHGPSVQELSNDLQMRTINLRDWLKSDQKLRVDESKRQGTAVNINTLFGMEGSFRKLAID